MEEIPEIWRFPLSTLKIFGLYSQKKNIVLVNIYLASLLYGIIILSIQFLNNAERTIPRYVYNLEGILVFVQMTVKIYPLYYQRKNLDGLINSRKWFWETNVCEDTVKKYLNTIFTNTSRIQKAFVYSVGVVSIFMIIYVPTKRGIPLGYWNMNQGSALHIVSLIVLAFGTSPCGTSIIACDSLFLGLGIGIIVQFKILSYKFNKLSVKQVTSEVNQQIYYSKLKLYIRHHNFLLRYVRSFQSYYWPAIFSEYLTISFLLCTEMYTFIETNSLEIRINNLISFVSLFLQLAFYCVTSDHITSAMIAVSDSLYDSDWYTNYFHGIRKPIILIMQKSQQQISFSAGGFEINSRTLITVLKASWSACAVIRYMKE